MTSAPPRPGTGAAGSTEGAFTHRQILLIISGLMEAEYHKLYGSAALMMVNEVHNKIQKKQ